MFDVILSKRFEKHPGHRMIQRREYVIEEGSSGHEFTRASELVLSLRPGQKVDMSMVFPERNVARNNYPRCQTVVIGSTDIRFQWYISHLLCILFKSETLC